MTVNSFAVPLLESNKLNFLAQSELEFLTRPFKVRLTVRPIAEVSRWCASTTYLGKSSGEGKKAQRLSDTNMQQSNRRTGLLQGGWRPHNNQI